MAVQADELRQCRAALLDDTSGDLRCQGEVTRWTTHSGDHWAYVDDKGNKIFWTDAIAVYPVANPNRTTVDEARDFQIGGDHYRKHKIQVWDIADEYDLNYFEGAILKYLLRIKGNRLEDLKKARHTLDRLIEIEEARGA